MRRRELNYSNSKDKGGEEKIIVFEHTCLDQSNSISIGKSLQNKQTHHCLFALFTKLAG